LSLKICCVRCSHRFETDKEPDPERLPGDGLCTPCHEFLIQYLGEEWKAVCRERHARFA
jgi:hypothetical protein